jgi:hypothetical protein
MSADDQRLTVTLTRSEWIAIIGSLAARPYAEVADLIEAIARQAGAQIEARDQAPEATARAN